MSTPPPAPTGEVQSPRPLNPSKVYPPPLETSHPASPIHPTPSLSSPSSSFDDNPSTKIPVSMTSLFRLLAGSIAFADWVLWARILDSHDDVFMVLIFVELLFLWLWIGFTQIYSRRRSLGKHLHLCPVAGGASCRVGPLRCILGGEDDDEDEAHTVVYAKAKTAQVTVAWVVDVFFAVSLLVFALVQPNQDWNWWMVRRDHVSTLVLLFLVVAFEFIVAIFAIAGIFLKDKSLALIFHADKIGSSSLQEYRIRLPQEQDVRALRNQPLSVAA